MLLDINFLKAHVCIFVYSFTRLLCISFIAPMKANLHTVSFNEKSQHYLYTTIFLELLFLCTSSGACIGGGA